MGGVIEGQMPKVADTTKKTLRKLKRNKRDLEEHTMTTFTSASANKYLKDLAAEKDLLLSNETRDSTYVLAADEKDEAPEYSYDDTRAKVDEIDRETLDVRHALHKFNMDTVLPESNITIDEALVLLAQMSAEAHRLNTMRNKKGKERTDSRSFGRFNNVIEYEYANYDIAKADADYRELSNRIFKLQLELDLANQTKTFKAPAPIVYAQV